jgi:hypothetical protein
MKARRVQTINVVRQAKIIRRLQDRARKRLARVKTHLGHGQFLKWVRKNFAMSSSTAGRYMMASRIAGKFRTVRNLDLSVLYSLHISRRKSSMKSRAAPNPSG